MLNMGDYQAPADLLAGRVILVTGAGDGIGRAAAEAFAAHGASVILLGRTVSKLEAVYDAIVAAGNPEPAIYPMDLRGATEADYEELATRITDEYQVLHGLLHNASVLGQRRNLEQTTLASWEEVLQVNVTANFLLTKALLPLMREAEDASIVFTSSTVGRQARAYWGAYAISKFAVEGMMQVLADELDTTSQIRVNSLNPRATNTQMRRTAYPGENPSTNPNPEQIMGTYLYLMGPDSRGVTGQAYDAR